MDEDEEEEEGDDEEQEEGDGDNGENGTGRSASRIEELDTVQVHKADVDQGRLLSWEQKTRRKWAEMPTPPWWLVNPLLANGHKKLWENLATRPRAPKRQVGKVIERVVGLKVADALVTRMVLVGGRLVLRDLGEAILKSRMGMGDRATPVRLQMEEVTSPVTAWQNCIALGREYFALEGKTYLNTIRRRYILYNVYREYKQAQEMSDHDLEELGIPAVTIKGKAQSKPTRARIHMIKVFSLLDAVSTEDEESEEYKAAWIKARNRWNQQQTEGKIYELFVNAAKGNVGILGLIPASFRTSE